MRRFIGMIWNSSQPTIKQEREESPSASVSGKCFFLEAGGLGHQGGERG
jgi:hypothetical protein